MSRQQAIFLAYGVPALFGESGESVSYTASGQSAATIDAIVDREVLAAVGPDDPGRVEYGVSIKVSSGDIASVTVGSDTVALKRRISDSGNTTFRVIAIISMDGGVWELGLG